MFSGPSGGVVGDRLKLSLWHTFEKQKHSVVQRQYKSHISIKKKILSCVAEMLAMINVLVHLALHDSKNM
jgi:hypothetical protein